MYNLNYISDKKGTEIFNFLYFLIKNVIYLKAFDKYILYACLTLNSGVKSSSNVQRNISATEIDLV